MSYLLLIELGRAMVGQFPAPLECSALAGSGVGGPRVDPFGQSLLGSEPVEQREELLTLGGLEAATELLLVLNGDLHDFAEQPPALLCEVQGPHATIAGVGRRRSRPLLEGVDQRWPTLQRRATTLFAINLLVLLSAVWAMEFKPTL